MIDPKLRYCRIGDTFYSGRPYTLVQTSPRYITTTPRLSGVVEQPISNPWFRFVDNRCFRLYFEVTYGNKN